MLIERPTIEEIHTIVKNDIYTTCPQLLIETLTERNNDEWIIMHDAASEGEDVSEILEYWLVSSWFGEGMRLIGQPTMELEPGIWIWGRTEAGLNLVHSSIIGDMMVARKERFKDLFEN
jgi:hypothetical protein